LVVKGASKIPVVGKPIGSVLHFANAPLALMEHVASGDRLDHAVIDNIKGQVKDVHDVAPYAQIVLSCVPGVGTVAAGAIGAGCALAEGQPITGVLTAGVQGAIPGGTVAHSLFSVGKGAIEHHKVTDLAIDALPVNELEKASIKATVHLAVKQSQRQPVSHDEALAAQKGLSPENRAALSVALAMGQAQQTQQDMLDNVTALTLSTLQQQGIAWIAAHPTVKAGEDMLGNQTPGSGLRTPARKEILSGARTPAGVPKRPSLEPEVVLADLRRGFEIGTGLMLYDLSPMHVTAVQSKLKNDGERHGFDFALAGHVGGVKEGATQFAHPDAQFAYRATLGAKNASPELKQRVVRTGTSSLHGTLGTLEAAKQVTISKEHWWVRWWHELKEILGIHD